MKTPTKLIAAFLTVLALSIAPTLIRAQDDSGAGGPPPGGDQDSSGGDQGASFQDFYNQLGSQGTWVQTDNYGYAFQPTVSDPNWAPYTDGHWVYTDVGWTWASDEPWGWATYHYGRWCNIEGTGWAWVPGYRWAPAWVSWRFGGGYCGWAPLPPETFIGAEFGGEGVFGGFHFGSDVDVDFHIGPGCYNFVAVGDLGNRNYGGAYLPRANNFVVINKTTNITNINISKTVINNYGTGGAAANFRGVKANGPSITEVNAQSRTPIQTVHLTAMGKPGRSSLSGDSLAVYAPAVNPSTLHQARPTEVARTLSHVTFNRGDSVSKPLAVNANLKPAAPTAAEVQAAQTAQLHAPASARVVTAKTKLKTRITTPLTSMKPVQQARPATRTATGESTEHTASGSPSAGEPVKPAATHTEEVKPAAETGDRAPGPATYHPETPAKPAPTTTYHPETPAKPAPTTTYHPETPAKPAPTYHPAPESHPQPAPPANHPPADKNGDGNENKNQNP
jgi:hypothetical protein